jgi:uncharacterized protein
VYPRHIIPDLLAALGDTPVVLLHGARQTGKSTLVQAICSGEHRARYLTLDDPTVLSAAQSDPHGFLAGLRGPVALDEVQHATALLRAIKLEVDRDRTPGRFLLTGSANVMLLPAASESLAGRMEILPFWPLSQGELSGVRETFVDRVMAGEAPEGEKSGRGDLAERIVRGGYPEAASRSAPRRRRAWVDSYITAILQRDVRELAHIDRLSEIPRLLSLLAARVGALANNAELSRSAGVPNSTLVRYMAMLRATFLLQPLPAWSRNLSKRLVRSAKTYLCDTALAAHLLGLDDPASLARSEKLGPLLENFVVMELRKQISWSEARPAMYHFRTHAGREVDVVLEAPCGDVVGIEVKASVGVSGADFAGLRALQEATGRQFRCGVVLHTGDQVLRFGPHLCAAPIGALWSAGAPAVGEG